MKNLAYGYRISIICGAIWFVDLLDTTLLNVALPEISNFFNIDPTNAEWALIGFLLAMTLGMIVSHPSGNFFGLRRIFLGAQWLYLASSAACGLSTNFPQLVVFRILQGFGGGLAIPLGMSIMLSSLPQEKWAKNASMINLFALLAPALGPILAGYITTHLNWRWLFFIKLPISFICVLLAQLWVHKVPRKRDEKFDWIGFYYLAVGLSLLLLVLSEIGKPLFSYQAQLTLFCASLLFLGLFLWQQTRPAHPLIPLKLFYYPLYAWGNLIQSAANVIFLGSTFITALYLQWGLGFTILETGWIMAAITLGMIAAMPFTGKYYNRLGPKPFMIPGLFFMAFSMFALIWVRNETSPWIIAGIIFIQGFGSAALQTTNVLSIFSEIPNTLKGSGSSVYALLKQVAASFGVALSTMMLTITLSSHGIEDLTTAASPRLYHSSFILLGIIPLAALPFTFFIDNKRALHQILKHEND
jgi:EmrB/QacA subfamily drug resistance transporter